MVSHYSHNTYILVRHGEARNNELNIVSSLGGNHEYPLTERGKNQIRETAFYIKKALPDIMIASPVLRTKESAHILREHLDIPLFFDERLVEVRFGKFEGKNVNSFLEYVRAHGGRLTDMKEEGIEGYTGVRQRVCAFLTDVSGALTGKKIVVVSHGDTLQEIYGELMGISVEESQRPGAAWFPHKGSCMIVTHAATEEFVPGRG